MRRFTIAAVAGALALAGLVPSASAQPPNPPPGCERAIEALMGVPAAAPGLAAVQARCVRSLSLPKVAGDPSVVRVPAGGPLDRHEP